MEIQNGVLMKVENEDINEDGGFDFPEGVQAIGERAFSRRTNLSHIELPEGLQSILEAAFEGCTKLSHIEFPEALQSIEDHAFRGCTSLSYIEFPEGLHFIGNDAFMDCTGLSHIKLPEGLQSIGHNAFYFCDRLSRIVIPYDNEKEYQRIKTLLPKNLQAVADKTREEILVRNAISVLGQASHSGFFANSNNDSELPKDIVLHNVCQKLINTSGLANFFPPQQTQAIFERAQNAERIEPTP